MLKRIWKAILAMFRGKKHGVESGKDTNRIKGTSRTGNTYAQVEAMTGTMPFAPEIHRLALLASGLKPYSHRMPWVRRMKVGGFNDAYRFWIRLCGQTGFSCVCSAGCVRYESAHPGKFPVFEFIGRSSVHGGVLAVIRVNAPVPDGQAKEIRFIVTNKNQIENENYQVRIHRKRGVPA